MNKITSQYQALVRLHNTFNKAIKDHRGIQKNHVPNSPLSKLTYCSFSRSFRVFFEARRAKENVSRNQSFRTLRYTSQARHSGRAEEFQKKSSVYDYEASVASLTKHFELYYMLLSSYLHKYLYRKYQANIQIKIRNKLNAKFVLHQCFKHKIIPAHETAVLRSMHPVYEMSTHIYDTDIAEEVSAAIPQYYTALSVLLPRITPDTLH